MVRVDDKIKTKLKELEKFNENQWGWSIQASKEVEEHLRLLVNMRICLLNAAAEVFNVSLLSSSEYFELQEQNNKHKRPEKDEQPPLLEISSLRSEVLWVVCSAASDKNATEIFYKRMLSEIMTTIKHRYDIINHLVKNIDFTTAAPQNFHTF